MSPAAWLRFDAARAWLELPGRRRVLELGPGRGAIAARLVRVGHDYTGVEFSEESRASTESLLASVGGRSRVVATLDDVPVSPQFDLLCAFEVLEHIEDDVAALTDWVGRVAPGGQVILSVPAWPDRFSVTDIEVGHLRRYTPAEFAALADAAGLVDVDVVLYGFPLGYVLEWVRARLAARRRSAESESVTERTKRSGAWYQPPRWANVGIQLATWPFRMIQRRVAGRGTGLVLHARVPST